GAEQQQLKVEPRHMEKALSGVLLRDATQLYVGFQLPKGPNSNVSDGPNPTTMGEIVSLPINGRLSAYDKKTGELRWASDLRYQMIILERFDEMPILLCSAMTTHGTGGLKGDVSVHDTVTL